MKKIYKILLCLSLFLMTGLTNIQYALAAPTFNVSCTNNKNGTVTVKVSGNVVGGFNVVAGKKTGQLSIKTIGGSDSATYNTGAGKITVKVTAISISDANYNLAEGVTVTKTVTVTNGKPKLSTTSKTLKVNNTVTLKVSNNVGSVSWSSSNSKVAKVNSSGKVTAVGEGSATITASVDGEKLNCKITVEKDKVTTSTTSTPKLNITNQTLKINHYITLKVTGNKGNVTWSTSNKNVATVISGKVTAVGEGTATITASVDGKKLTCKVTVPKSDTSTKPVTQNPSTTKKNTDNNLKSLSVKASDGKELVLSPEFKASTTTYAVSTVNSYSSINIKAVANDAKAKVEGTGDFEINTGENNFMITVTSESGEKKTYTISVTSENKPEIYLNYNSEKLGVVNDLTKVDTPKNFEIKDIEISGAKCTSLYSEKYGGLTLLYLQANDMSHDFYIYSNDKVLQPIKTLQRNSQTYIVLDDIKQEVEGTKASTIKIDDVEMNCLEYEGELKGFVLLNLIDEQGNQCLYRYDTLDTSLQKSTLNQIDMSPKNMYPIEVVGGLGGIAGVSFIAFIVTLIIHRKYKKTSIKRVKELIKEEENEGKHCKK